MPTERFYRLPEAKKQVIRQAAIKELREFPLRRPLSTRSYRTRIFPAEAFTPILKISRMWSAIFLRTMRDRCRNAVKGSWTKMTVISSTC